MGELSSVLEPSSTGVSLIISGDDTESIGITMSDALLLLGLGPPSSICIITIPIFGSAFTGSGELASERLSDGVSSEELSDGSSIVV
jgi:hypothetical protein